MSSVATFAVSGEVVGELRGGAAGVGRVEWIPGRGPESQVFYPGVIAVEWCEDEDRTFLGSLVGREPD